MANALGVKALDHALRKGCGRSLADFIPQTALTPLKQTETRYLVLNSDLPKAYQKAECIGRSCVVDEATGDRRLEVPAEMLSEPSLHLRSDQGSMGWVGNNCLFAEGQSVLSGTSIWDPCHYLANQLSNAIKAAGLWFSVCELVVVLNLCQGPWMGSAWFQTAKDAMSEYLAESSPECPLFLCMYEWLARDLGEDGPAHFGLKSHLTSVWARISDADVFRRKGFRVKLSRWMSVWDSLAVFLDSWSAFYLVLTYMCLKNGIIKSVADMQMYKDEWVLADGEEAPAPAAHNRPQNREVRHSNGELAKLRQKSRNTLHLATMILGSAFKRSVVVGMLCVVQAFRKNFGLVVQAMKSQRSAIDYWSLHVSGDVSELCEMLDVLFHPAHFDKVGFLGAEWYTDDEQGPEVASDMKLAQVLFQPVIQVMAHRLVGELNVSHSLPNKTAMLVNSDPSVVSKGLQELKLWWGKLCCYEKMTHTTKTVADLLHDMEWPRLHWVCLVLLSLAEADFSVVLAPVMSKLMAL